MEIEINYLAVICAGISAMVVGFLWYGPLFGKYWIKQMGWSADHMEKMKHKMKNEGGMGMMYGKAFIAALVMAYVLAHFVELLGVSDVHMALVLAFWVWLGFFATALVDGVLWEGKSWSLYALNAGSKLVTVAVMSLILSMWG